MNTSPSEQRLHQDGPVMTAGASPSVAKSAMVMLHGRGASAEDILGLSRELKTSDIAYFAPQAVQNTWYPHSFLYPRESNEPWLSSALNRVDELVEEIAASGIAYERIYLLGFSQGACLASEYVARHARRYAGLFALSGGLIGPKIRVGDYEGDSAGTPVFLGCSDVDPHIPALRVEESAEVFRKLNAEVTLRLYPRMGHTINSDEVQFIQSLLD